MNYVVEVHFKSSIDPNVASRLFGVFQSAERAQVFAMGIMQTAQLFSVYAPMDYKVRPLERVEG